MKTLVRKLRRIGGCLFEWAGEWAGVGLLYGLRVFSNTPTPHHLEPARRILFIGAHPDDESGCAGGALAQHARNGDEVTVLIVTDGGASRAGALPRDEMAARRALELQAATQVLGVRRVLTLGLTEITWDPDSARAAIAAELARADMVYTHGPVDYHPDHLKVGRLISDIVPDSQFVRLCEAQTLLTPLLTNVAVALAPADRAARDAAWAAHQTQAGSARAIARMRRLERRAHGARDLEFFWQLDGAALRRVMAAAPWRDHATAPFRGVRLRGFSDPLAVLRGTFGRLHLRQAARESGESK